MSVTKQDAIHQYCLSKSSGISETAQEIYQKTLDSTFNERLMVDMVGARFLGLISKSLSPKKILEIGTFSGFSAQILAEGLSEEGEIVSIEIDKEHYSFAKANLEHSPESKKIQLILGDALEVMENLEASFDLVFLDAAKRQYTKHYEMALSKCHSGALIIADNSLWKNRVLLEDADNMTKGIQDFNEFVKNDNRVDNVLIPVGDGIHLIYKK